MDELELPPPRKNEQTQLVRHGVSVALTNGVSHTAYGARALRSIRSWIENPIQPPILAGSDNTSSYENHDWLEAPDIAGTAPWLDLRKNDTANPTPNECAWDQNFSNNKRFGGKGQL